MIFSIVTPPSLQICKQETTKILTIFLYYRLTRFTR
nr:MAG TPA: hypothetical protein [Bacteriophage sp.]